MDDLISRQAAIDAFKKELTAGESKGNYVTICSVVGYEGAKKILERLPSAEPEIIRCKDCKWWQDNNNGYPIADCKWDREETPDADDFCSCGERLDTE